MTMKVIIFTLILSMNIISPVSADEECTNLSQQDIQSSIDIATEGKTPSEVSVEAIINQINQDFNTNCTQEQFFNFYKIADNFVNNLSLFRNQAATAVASTQQFMVDVEALNLGPIAEIANAGSQNMDQVNALDERIAVLEQRNEELMKELGDSTSSENLSDSSNTANSDETNSLLEQIDQLYSLQGTAFEIESLQQQVKSLNDYAIELQGLIDSASEDSDTSAVEEQLTTTREEISSLEAVITERESTVNGLTITDINNRISELEAQIAQLQSESNSTGSNSDTSTPPSDNPLEQEFQRNIEELGRLQQQVETLLTNVSQSSEEAVNTSINEANLMQQEAMDLYFGVFVELKLAADYLAMLEIHDRAFFNGMLRVASNCDAEYYKSNGLELQYGKLIKKLSDVSSILEETANNLRSVSVFEATTFNALKQKYASMGIDFNFQFFECPIDEPNCEPPPPPEG